MIYRRQDTECDRKIFRRPTALAQLESDIEKVLSTINDMYAIPKQSVSLKSIYSVSSGLSENCNMKIVS